jgi:hypothetical protein
VRTHSSCGRLLINGFHQSQTIELAILVEDRDKGDRATTTRRDLPSPPALDYQHLVCGYIPLYLYLLSYVKGSGQGRRW